MGPLISRNASITHSPDIARPFSPLLAHCGGTRCALPVWLSIASMGSYICGQRREETMAKIRHLAIKTKNPERLAAFYEEVFGLKRIRSEKGGAIYMSDGYLKIGRASC